MPSTRRPGTRDATAIARRRPRTGRCGPGPTKWRRGRSRGALEERLDLPDQARDRLLVVRRRDTHDQVAVTELDERGELLGNVFRRPDRLVLPQPRVAVVVERLLED